MTEAELTQLAPNAEQLLRVEVDAGAPVFRALPSCPECLRALTPRRIGQREAWLLGCQGCQHTWLRKREAFILNEVSKALLRQQAFATLSPEERAEFTRDLAQTVADEAEPELTFGQMITAAIGIPRLVKVKSHRTAWATWSVSAALVLVFFVTEPNALAYVVGSSAPAALLTATFAHASLSHLLGNLFFLLSFGDALEQRVSRWWLLVSFLVVGPLTIGAQVLLEDPGHLVLGASGAIAFILAAACVVQPQARMLMSIGFRIRSLVQLPLPVWAVLYVLLQLGGLAFDVPGVAWASHLLGLVLGLSFGAWARTRPAPRAAV